MVHFFGAFNVAGEAATRVSTRNVSMKIGVLFFGALKDIVGRSGETVDLPEGARVREVLFYYARRAPRFEAMAPSLATTGCVSTPSPDVTASAALLDPSEAKATLHT